MSDLASWLEPRLASAPSILRERILAAIHAADDSPFPIPRSRVDEVVERVESDNPAPRSPLPDQLWQLAERLLESVKNAGNDAVAIDLLAADALITYACEALSERDPDGLADIA